VAAKKFVFWFLLGLIGQAASLQLIDAGKRLHYQHYIPLREISSPIHLAALLILVVQAAFVTAGIFRIRREIIQSLSKHFKLWQIALFLSLLVCTSAAVSEQFHVFLSELVFASVIQMMNLGNLVLICRSIPEKTIASLREKFSRYTDRTALICAAWVFLLATLLNIFSYQRHPHITDEVIYLLHARFLANGTIALPVPEAPRAFEVNLMESKNGRRYPAPPPGWPAVLALGVMIGAPWIINPLLASLNIFLIFYLAREIYDSRIARLTVFLLSVSPWYIFLAMSFMTHMLTLACALVGAVGVIKARKGLWLWGFVTGSAIGLAGLIRPLDGLIIGFLLGFSALTGGKKRIARIAALAAGAILLGAAGLLYNNHLTGDPLIFPINEYNDARYGKNTNAYGFGPDRGFGWGIDPYRGHGPLDALVNTNLNTYSIQVEMFGWSTGSLLFFLVRIVLGKFQKRDLLMISVLLAVYIAYFFYYFSGGPDFGARYWFIMIVPIAVLTASGCYLLQEKFGSNRVLTAVVVLSLFSLINYFPWRAVDKYYHYLGMRPDIRELARQHNFGRSLVLVRGRSYPDYASATVYNPLDLKADAPVYAWDTGPDIRRELFRIYRDRPVWIVDGPSITGKGYQIKAGPLKPDENGWNEN
jgi:4-amino-4-deoxy-L-arabinose transferase-like glycosyltransferase